MDDATDGHVPQPRMALGVGAVLGASAAWVLGPQTAPAAACIAATAGAWLLTLDVSMPQADRATPAALLAGAGAALATFGGLGLAGLLVTLPDDVRRVAMVMACVSLGTAIWRIARVPGLRIKLSWSWTLDRDTQPSPDGK